MINPISNDKILPPGSERNSASADDRAEGAAQKSTPTPTKGSEDTLNLSQAGRLANQGVTSTGSRGNITGEAQAKALASRIREQIEASGTQALSLHGRLDSGQLTALLGSSTA